MYFACFVYDYKVATTVYPHTLYNKLLIQKKMMADCGSYFITTLNKTKIKIKNKKNEK